MVPSVELPPAMPFTLHVTAVLVDPLTVAPNCRVVETGTPALEGETLTVIGFATVIRKLTAELVVPPRPVFVTVIGTEVPTCEAVVVPLALSPVEDSRVVASAPPPRFTTEFPPKFAPFN